MFANVEYWLNSADKDIAAARLLLDGKMFLHAGFFFHLIIEKALKAVIASVTSDIPPKTHDLTKLAERGGIYDDLTELQLSFLEELNPLNIEARYSTSERVSKILTYERASALFKETEGFLCWIKQRLEK